MSRKVKIRYLAKDTNNPQEVSIPYEEYYDLVEKGEEYLIHGVAKYQEPYMYVGMNPEDLRWLVLIEPLECDYKIFRYQYMDGTNSFMVHTQWPNGDEEIIHSINAGLEQVVITRTSKENGKSWATVACGKVDTNDQYNEYTGGNSFSELLSFQEVE